MREPTISAVGAVVIGVDHSHDVAHDLRIAGDQTEAATLLDVLLGVVEASTNARRRRSPAACRGNGPCRRRYATASRRPSAARSSSLRSLLAPPRLVCAISARTDDAAPDCRGQRIVNRLDSKRKITMSMVFLARSIASTIGATPSSGRMISCM